MISHYLFNKAERAIIVERNAPNGDTPAPKYPSLQLIRP